jgi:hypothetical protein
VTVLGYRLATAGFEAIDDPTLSRQLGSGVPWQLEQFFESDGVLAGYVVSDARVVDVGVDGAVVGLTGVAEVLTALVVAKVAMGFVEPSELRSLTPLPGGDVDLAALGFEADARVLVIGDAPPVDAWVQREYGLRTVVADLGDCLLGVIQRGGDVVRLERAPDLDVD